MICRCSSVVDEDDDDEDEGERREEEMEATRARSIRMAIIVLPQVRGIPDHPDFRCS